MQKAEKTGFGRRKFLGAAAAVMLAGALVQIGGCSTDEEGRVDVSGLIDNNHGHSAKVTRVQLEAGGAVTLDIQGSSGHTHTVALTAEEVKAIAAGTHVMMNSSSSSQSPVHLHVVMFN